MWGRDRNFNVHARSPSCRTVDRKAAVERLDPVDEAAQSASLGGVGTTDPVVGDIRRHDALAVQLHSDGRTRRAART